MKKFIHNFEVVANNRLNAQHFVLELLCSEKLPVILPGQFAEVRIDKSFTTYLRRPFSIHNVDYKRNTISFLVKQIGAATSNLSTAVVGEIINVVYPLGNGFILPSSGKVLLVGGGCGVAPLLFLARHLYSLGIQITTLITIPNRLPEIIRKPNRMAIRIRIIAISSLMPTPIRIKTSGITIPIPGPM